MGCHFLFLFGLLFINSFQFRKSSSSASMTCNVSLTNNSVNDRKTLTLVYKRNKSLCMLPMHEKFASVNRYPRHYTNRLAYETLIKISTGFTNILFRRMKLKGVCNVRRCFCPLVLQKQHSFGFLIE